MHYGEIFFIRRTSKHARSLEEKKRLTLHAWNAGHQLVVGGRNMKEGGAAADDRPYAASRSSNI